MCRSIGKSCFENCKKFKSIEFSNGIKYRTANRARARVRCPTKLPGTGEHGQVRARARACPDQPILPVLARAHICFARAKCLILICIIKQIIL